MCNWTNSQTGSWRLHSSSQRKKTHYLSERIRVDSCDIYELVGILQCFDKLWYYIYFTAAEMCMKSAEYKPIQARICINQCYSQEIHSTLLLVYIFVFAIKMQSIPKERRWSIHFGHSRVRSNRISRIQISQTHCHCMFNSISFI